MAISNLPPQAYTKEVLAEAYAWLTNQPDQIKKKATNADSLISLYLRAKRLSETDKVSAEEFKAELKSLAGMMNTFSPPTGQMRDQGMNFAPSPNQAPPSPAQPQNSVGNPPAATMPTNSLGSSHSFDPSSHSAPTSPGLGQPNGQEGAPFTPEPGPVAQSGPTPTKSFTDGLDRQTNMMLYEVKMRLNLSSETEALRMLVRLGYRKVKDLLPDDELF